MSDVALPGRPAAPGGNAGSVSSLGGTSGAGKVSDPPPGLIRLGPGSLVKGVVTGRNEAGQTLIKTDLGVLAVATRQALPPGREVVLQIRAAGSELHVAILPSNHPAANQQATGQKAPNPLASAPQAPGARPAAAQAPAGQLPPGQAPAGQLPPGQASAGQLPAQGGATAALPLAGEAAPSGTPGQIQQAPPSIARLASGSLLPATVLGREADGQILLRTELGTLSLSTEARLSRGAAVLLQVKAAVPDLQVSVLPAPSGKGAAQGSQIQGAGHAAATADRLAVGQPIRALVVSTPFAIAASNLAAAGAGQAANTTTANGPAASATAATTAAQGASVQAVPQAAPQAPQAAPAPLAGGQATPAPAPASPPAGATGSAPQAAPQVASETLVLKAGSEIALRVTQSVPAGATPQGQAQVPAQAGTLAAGAAPVLTAPGGPPGVPVTAAALAPASEGETLVQATVIGRTSAGQPILETSVGVLRLTQPMPLAEGSRLTLALPASAFQNPLPGLAELPPASPAQLMHSWPALDNLLGLFDQGEPAILREAAERLLPGPSIPQPGGRLASGLLFFLSALSGGDPGEWLQGLYQGRAGKLMEREGRQDLSTRLRGDLGQMARLGDAAGPDWRFLPLPFFDGQSVQQLRLFLRQRSKERNQSDEEATRFVLDVDLTRFGELQFDGLIRPQRFDMVLRSRRPFPAWMRGDIQAIFEQANAIGGSKGQLSFQASGDWGAVELQAPRDQQSGLMA